MNIVAETTAPRRRLRFPLTVGQSFGDWTVVGPPLLIPSGKKERIAYQCRCICDTLRIVLANNLRNGASTGCGCTLSQKKSLWARRHGGYQTKLYRVWSFMKERCRNPNATSYEFYGGRGISVCAEWLDFAVFRDWAESHGYRHGLSLDRIDPNGNYCPENCRWVSIKKQQYNKRNTVYLTAFGETKCVAEWAKDPRCFTNCRQSLLGRIKAGWTNQQEIVALPSCRGQKGKGHG